MSWYGIHFLSMVYLGLFVPLSFPVSRFFDKAGLKKALLVGVGLSVLGLGSKCLISFSPWFVYLGQTLLSVGQPFIYNMPVALSA